MALNQDEHHPAHSVSDYFEVLKVRYPALYLLKNELEKPDSIEQLDQKVKDSAKIQKQGGKTG